MKLLKITIFVFVSLSLSSFSEKAEPTNSIFLELEYNTGGTACRDISTSCGGGSFSTNRACVTYTNGNERAGALFLAGSIASEMGIAGCKRLGEIKAATAHISDKN
ncbi:hypothetical protein H7F37_08995 [Winogradskyella sp. PAMC22761]|nr:hypothetical protein H7F37_08995 [Winogradskyella sp. PAMC22761]